jgi:hypothetical protein
MTIKEAERIRLAVQEELERSGESLLRAGVTWSRPEIIESKAGEDAGTLELKVSFYKSGDLVDVFEFLICQAGTVVVSEPEVRRWIQEQIPDVISGSGGRCH